MLIHAVVAAVHILPQRDIAADGPVPVQIESTLGIPRVDQSRIGVDGEAPFCLFKLEGSIILTQVDIVAGVAESPVPVVTLVNKGDHALVFDVQVAGGVHRQRFAVAKKVNIGDDILVGNDIHRSVVQHLHGAAADGAVDTAAGIAFTGALDIPPGYLDLQLGVVLHGQSAGFDARDSIALRAALPIIHVDVHGGAADELGKFSVFQCHFSGVDAAYRDAVLNGRITDKVDVQRTAAGNGHIAALLGANGTCIPKGAGALQVHGQRLAGEDMQIDAFSEIIQQAVVAAHGRIILHKDIDSTI